MKKSTTNSTFDKLPNFVLLIEGLLQETKLELKNEGFTGSDNLKNEKKKIGGRKYGKESTEKSETTIRDFFGST